ncbi:hypothetical protein [Methanobacterium bryantii]|uniref:Uncharacterized protein n=1 Tax=Methanobacterium bryantii TaxID=2161 RepID=A0A2A2H7U4_METBR|nr:hypothetical protein [Methanobacterium bryantii]PAV05467.1 hypothetical protein ASJ80_09470 [Methanobacterium bryantii]
MKPKNTSLVNIGYLKNKNTYHTTFQVSNLNTKERKLIIERKKMLGITNPRIYEAGADLYIFKHFTAIEFEVYKSLVEFAKKGIIPERIDPKVLEAELDICMLEEELEIHISRLNETHELKKY